MKNGWYVLFVLTGEEEKVKKRLKYVLDSKTLQVFLPKRRLRERSKGIWKHRIRLLFPGYVFLKGHMDEKVYYSIKKVPGILRVLKNGCEIAPMMEEEMIIISRLMGEGGIIGDSLVLEKEDKIVVNKGPLAGLEGLIQSIDKRKGRARVRLNFMGEPRLVDLGIITVNRLPQ